MSDDRLEELRRQRALAAEQQARLEREIAAAEAAAALEKSLSSLPGARSPIAPNLSPEARQEIEAEANRLLESQRQEPKAVHQGVFRGCLLYVILAFVLTGVGSVALYFVFKALR
jgi:hypothetical protein